MRKPIIICGESALDFRRAQAGALFPSYEEVLWESKRRIRGDDYVCKLAISAMKQLGLPAPLHLLAGGPGARRNSRLVRFHYYSNAPKAEDLEEILPGVCVCSPPLAIAQASIRAEAAGASLLMLEFCGTYALSPQSRSGFVNTRRPIMKKADLEDAFADRERTPRYGRCPREDALACLAENSNSPAESSVHALLSLPVEHGGFGIEGILLNEPVKLNLRGTEMLGTNQIRPDFLIPTARTAGEYKSRMFHPEGSWTNDDRRIDALEATGYHTFTLNNERSRSLADFAAIAHAIKVRCGAGPDTPDEEALRRQTDLHRRLFLSPPQVRKASELEGDEFARHADPFTCGYTTLN